MRNARSNRLFIGARTSRTAHMEGQAGTRGRTGDALCSGEKERKSGRRVLHRQHEVQMMTFGKPGAAHHAGSGNATTAMKEARATDETLKKRRPQRGAEWKAGRLHA
ncbi:hypothetical protein JCM10599A_34750 [Paraburkholderia kururiensis]